MHPSYYLIVALSSSLDVEYLSSVGSRVFFVSGCSAVSCDFGVFVRSEFTSFYSVLSPSCNFNYRQTPGVTQGHTAVQWWSQDSNPGSYFTVVPLLHPYLCVSYNNKWNVSCSQFNKVNSHSVYVNKLINGEKATTAVSSHPLMAGQNWKNWYISDPLELRHLSFYRGGRLGASQENSQCFSFLGMRGPLPFFHSSLLGNQLEVLLPLTSCWPQGGW